MNNEQNNHKMDLVEERAQIVVPLKMVRIEKRVLQKKRRERAEHECVELWHEKVVDDWIYLRNDAPQKFVTEEE